MIDIELEPERDSAFAGAVLRIATATRTLEFDLPPRADARFSLLLPREPVTSAWLAAPPGSPSQTLSVRISPVSTLRLAARAVAIDPAEAVRAAYWRLLGLKVRARNRLKRLMTLPEGADASGWLARHTDTWNAEIEAIVARQAGTPGMPRFAVLTPEPAPPSEIFERSDRATSRRPGSDETPAYPHLSSQAWHRAPADETATSDRLEWTPRQLLRAIGRMDADGDAAQDADRAADRDADWIVLLRSGDRLLDGAVWRLADAASRHPDAQLFYGDQILRDPETGARTPFLTPEWNEPYFIAIGYTGPIALRRQTLADALEQLPDTSLPLDLIIDCVTLTVARSMPRRARDVVMRIPRVLSSACPKRHHARLTQDTRTLRAAAIGPLLATETCGVGMDRFGWPRPRYRLPDDRPLVSIIVPTRDRVDLLRPCIDGLQRRTCYGPIEILIVDNGSTDSKTHAYFASLKSDGRIRVLDDAGPFNYAAINNRAASAAHGRVLAFLNNDTDVVARDWLGELVAPALQDHIGAVGCRLDYPAGPIQHGGVIVGLNRLAGHAHRFFDPAHPGYMRRLHSTHYVSAVTAACMVIEKTKFIGIGGFDEHAFPIAFNDVDLCLRLQSRGFENLYVASARLVHKESASRAHDTSRARGGDYDKECRHLRERWAPIIDADPYYHPLLTRTSEDFSLA